MRKTLMLTVLLLLGWSSDYDYLRAMRDTSPHAFQRWWNYRSDRVVFDDQVAQADSVQAMGRQT